MRTVLVLALTAVATACGGVAGEGAATSSTVIDTTLSSSTTIPAVSPTTSSSTTTTSITEDAPVMSGPFELITGGLDVRAGDIFIVHEDGDLWVHPGLRDGTTSGAYRIADMGDPRVPLTEGGGPNTVDGVAGEVNGVVYYSDCCEPISGNLLAATGSPGQRQTVGFGYSPVLSPDHTQLATANSYGLWLVDLSAGSYTFRSLNNSGTSFLNVWDLIWSPDGEQLVVLYFDENGFSLLPFAASASLEPGEPVSIHQTFDPAGDPGVRFVGSGPNGEIALATFGDDSTDIRFFEATTLTELPAMQRTLPAAVTSVRLDSDGTGLMWIEDGTLWYLPSGGPVRYLGDGCTAAWFAS